MRKYLLLYSLIFSTFLVFGATYTTTAVVGTWAEGGSPGQNDNITVNHDWSSQNSGLGNPLSICKGTITINSGGYYKVWGALAVQGGGDIILASGGTMEVSGSLDINGAAGTITLNGSFITLGATVNGATVTGAGTWTWAGSFTNNGTINGYTGDPTESPFSIATLPVELISFALNKTDENTVELNWITVSEINNEKFIIERSFDGVNYESIGEKSGQGTSYSINEYYFMDEESSSKTVYYRLKQIDFDGQFDYSKVLVCNAKFESMTLTQASNNLLIARNLPANDVTWKIYNMNGQELLSLNANANDENSATLALQNLEQGCYVVVVYCGMDKVSVKVVF